MGQLTALREASSLEDFCVLLGVDPKMVRYSLFGLADAAKYRAFEIPKKGGGTRHIQAPGEQISFLQGRLKSVLDSCVEEIRSKHPRYFECAYGFLPKRSIVDNAK